MQGIVDKFVINVGDDSDEETKFQVESNDNETSNDGDRSSLGKPL
jgi:hypothetical protein